NKKLENGKEVCLSRYSRHRKLRRAKEEIPTWRRSSTEGLKTTFAWPLLTGRPRLFPKRLRILLPKRAPLYQYLQRLRVTGTMICGSLTSFVDQRRDHLVRL